MRVVKFDLASVVTNCNESIAPQCDKMTLNHVRNSRFYWHNSNSWYKRSKFFGSIFVFLVLTKNKYSDHCLTFYGGSTSWGRVTENKCNRARTKTYVVVQENGTLYQNETESLTEPNNGSWISYDENFISPTKIWLLIAVSCRKRLEPTVLCPWWRRVKSSQETTWNAIIQSIHQWPLQKYLGYVYYRVTNYKASTSWSSYDISDPSQLSKHSHALPSRHSSYDGSPNPHCLIQDTFCRPETKQIPESSIDSNPNNAWSS